MELKKEIIKSYLPTNEEVLVYQEVDSTSNVIRDKIASYPNGLVVASLRQTAGRGRKGNSYKSNQESMYFTYAKKVSNGVSGKDLFTLRACNAVSRVYQELYNLNIQIKWVNDLFFNFKKCGGILCELIFNNDNQYILFGIGTNVNVNIDEELSSFATSLKIDNFDVSSTIGKIIKDINKPYSPIETLSYYKEHMFLINKEITFTLNNISYIGIVKDINELGNLIVEVDHKKMILNSGEVSLKSKLISKAFNQ